MEDQNIEREGTTKKLHLCITEFRHQSISYPEATPLLLLHGCTRDVFVYSLEG